jgi:hypothetical protein
VTLDKGYIMISQRLIGEELFITSRIWSHGRAEWNDIDPCLDRAVERSRVHVVGGLIVPAERVFVHHGYGGSRRLCCFESRRACQHTDTASSDCRCHGNILKQMVIRSAS